MRGECGHRHTSHSAAQECADRDHSAVVAGNGSNAYSDRDVYAVDAKGLAVVDANDEEYDEYDYRY